MFEALSQETCRISLESIGFSVRKRLCSGYILAARHIVECALHDLLSITIYYNRRKGRLFFSAEKASFKNQGRPQDLPEIGGSVPCDTSFCDACAGIRGRTADGSRLRLVFGFYSGLYVQKMS